MIHMFDPFIIKLIIVLLQLSATSKPAQRYSSDSASGGDNQVTDNLFITLMSSLLHPACLHCRRNCNLRGPCSQVCNITNFLRVDAKV
jgi:hypothetical protein